MDLETTWRDCRYLQDLLDQPDAVARTIDGLEEEDDPGAPARRLAAGRFRRVVLTGMGSSYWACRPLYLRLLAGGRTPAMVETGELIHFERDWLSEDTLVVAVSQSGRSAEIVRLLELARGRAEILGVTNAPDSPLGTHSAGVLATRAGAEHTVSCKTYLATMVALEWLGDLLCAGDTAALGTQVREIVDPMRNYLLRWRVHTEELMRSLTGATEIFVVGRGGSLAAAGTGGLILKESTHCHGEGMSAAAFRHGPFEMVSGEVFVLVLEGDERAALLNRKLAADITAAGGRAAMVSPLADGALRIPRVSGRMLPLLEILPVQMMTLALAAAKGKEPGTFTRATKVTEVE